jgi:AraC family transcriptional regulator
MRHWDEMVRESVSHRPATMCHALEFIDAHLGERLTLVRMADEVRLSPFHFAHLFKRQVGVAPHQYVMRRRLERAKVLLVQTNLPIVTIAMDLGFANQSHFSEIFHRETGDSPLSFRLHR